MACALGDTLGLPYEYSTLTFLPEVTILAQHPHATWSDDTQQSLILLDEYLRFGNLDPHRFMKRLVEYRDYPAGGYFGLHRGTGRGFRHSVDAYSETGLFSPMPGRDGNGAAMRVASVAFLMPSNDDSLLQINAITQSTHDMPNSFHAAEAVVRSVWAVREGLTGLDALSVVATQLPEGQVREVINRLGTTSNWIEAICAENPALGPGHGYSLRSPLSAIYIALHSSSIKDAIVQSLALGDDTDSTASIAAAIASAIHPLDELEADLFNFRGREDLLAWDNSSGPQSDDYLVALEARLA